MARLKRTIDHAQVVSASTTFTWETAKMPGFPPGGKQNGSAAGRWGKLSRRNPRDKLTLTISYRGGNEGWWLVEARGSHGVFPAAAQLHDVMREVLNIHEHRPGS